VVLDLSVLQVRQMLSLDQVSNTSDANKPISTAVQNAINSLVSINSPNFTGVPTVPTAVNGTNTGQIASTQFVNSSISAAVIGGGYILPVASSGTLGGVMVGSGLSINSGVLSTSATVAKSLFTFGGGGANIGD